MREIKYIVGDVREPIGEGNKLIIHCVNSIGVMGSGVARALFKKWPVVRERYLEWSKQGNFTLGNVQFLSVDGGKSIAVANMIGQEGVGLDKDGKPPIRYEAMRECLVRVADLVLRHKASVHIPYLMGCDLAGGSWDVVEPMIIEELCSKDIEVTVYDLFNKRGAK